MESLVVRFGTRLALCIATGVVVPLRMGAAQGTPIDGSYTVNASRAVASWPEVGGASPDPRLVLDGAGGSVVLLDLTTASTPTQWLGVADPVLNTGGIVWDIEARGDGAGKLSQVWCAAGSAGLVRFTRDTLTNAFLQDIAFRTVGNATCLALFQVGTKVYAFVGTNDSRTRGRVHLVDPDPSAGARPRILDTWEVGQFFTSSAPVIGGPVYSLAATTALSATNVTLLVGTACQGVFRFDIATSSLSFGSTAPVKWTPTSGARIFARDIVIDTEGSGRGYVAANRNGVYALNLSGGLLAEDTSTGWPLQPVTSALTYSIGVALKKGLANPVTGTRLVIALGPSFVGEHGHHGDCVKQSPCDCDGSMTDCDIESAIWAVDVFRNVDARSGPPQNEASYHPNPGDPDFDPAPSSTCRTGHRARRSLAPA